MNCKIAVFFFLIGILNISCKQENKTKSASRIINSEFKKNDCLKLSDFVESIELIPLETNLSCLIGTVGKIVKYKDLYFIGAASNIIDKILIFDKHGKFVYKLDKRGLGSGEYTEIRDFDVVDEHKIAIVSHSNPGIYVYDISKDTCMLHKNIDIYPNNILVKDSFFYIMNNGTKYHKETNDLIFEYDKKGCFVKSLFRINDRNLKIISNVAPLVSLTLNENNMYFNYPFCNTIYRVDDRNIYSEYKLDFGKRGIPENILDKSENILDIEKIIRNNKGYNMQQYYAINSIYTIFTFFDYEYNGYILLHKQTDNQILIAHEIIDDLYFVGNKFELKAWKMPKLLDNNTIYYHVEPGDLIEQYEQFKKKADEKEWKYFCNNNFRLIEKLEKMKEDDNPLILIVNLKK